MAWVRSVGDWGSLVAGVFVAGLGLASFLIPSHFIDGGVTGVSMLLGNATGIPLPFVLMLVNGPFVALGYQHIGKSFALRSCFAIAGLALCIWLIPFPVATHDKLLGATFGGIFIGAGVGLAIRGGGVLDGTEILAVILSKKTFATVGEVLLALNVIIFSLAAFSLGIESALYSVLTYLAATKTIDFLLHGIEAYQGMLIVSVHQESIRQAILNELGRGVTAFKATGGYTSTEQDVLFCVVTRLEVSRLENIVKSKDENAFMVILPVLETSGGVLKKRVFH